jgi:CHAD domain-containing protein
MVRSAQLLPVEAWLDELARQIELLRERVEPDAVHRMRVACGRLSVWLELGARRALRDDLKRLRRSAGRVRDLDVVGARDGGARAPALAGERAAEAARLSAALDAARTRALLEALALVPEPDPVAVRVALRRLKRRLLEAGAGLRADSEDDRALHQLRRRARRLRYALDWLGAESKQLRELQECLGELGDLVLELAELEPHLGDERAGQQRDARGPNAHARDETARDGHDERRRAELVAERARARERALEAWSALRPKVPGL